MRSKNVAGGGRTLGAPAHLPCGRFDHAAVSLSKPTLRVTSTLDRKPLDSIRTQIRRSESTDNINNIDNASRKLKQKQLVGDHPNVIAQK
jgi:hypothetical protein